MEKIFSKYTASISELKKNPAALLREAAGEPVAILNHNRATAYLIPVEIYESMLEAIVDQDLAEIVRTRLEEGEAPIDVDIDEL